MPVPGPAATTRAGPCISDGMALGLVQGVQQGITGKTVFCFRFSVFCEFSSRGLVSSKGGVRFPGRWGSASRGGGGEAEEGALALQPPALLRGKEANFPILAVVAAGNVHLAPTHLVDGMGQQRSGFASFPGQVLQGNPAQDLQFRPQGLQQPEIALAQLFAGGRPPAAPRLRTSGRAIRDS